MLFVKNPAPAFNVSHILHLCMHLPISIIGTANTINIMFYFYVMNPFGTGGTILCPSTYKMLKDFGISFGQNLIRPERVKYVYIKTLFLFIFNNKTTQH